MYVMHIQNPSTQLARRRSNSYNTDLARLPASNARIKHWRNSRSNHINNIGHGVSDTTVQTVNMKENNNQGM